MIEFQKYAPLDSSQPPFNIFERAAHKGIINYCVKEEIALSAADFAEIDQIIHACVKHPVEPEFMAPPVRKE